MEIHPAEKTASVRRVEKKLKYHHTFPQHYELNIKECGPYVMSAKNRRRSVGVWGEAD